MKGIQGTDLTSRFRQDRPRDAPLRFLQIDSQHFHRSKDPFAVTVHRGKVFRSFAKLPSERSETVNGFAHL